jgi:hypothetical protein
LFAGVDLPGEAAHDYIAPTSGEEKSRPRPIRGGAGIHAESTFLERASERMWKCEVLFAESKQYHCLARAKYRGRSKVQIQAYLCAIVQNLKRLLFPLYCWLVARWSPPAIPRPFIQQISRIIAATMLLIEKSNRTFSTGPTLFREFCEPAHGMLRRLKDGLGSFRFSAEVKSTEARKHDGSSVLGRIDREH